MLRDIHADAAREYPDLRRADGAAVMPRGLLPGRRAIGGERPYRLTHGPTLD